MVNDTTVSYEILINGKKFRIDGTVDFKATLLDDNPIPDPDPDPTTKPTQGIIKDGGWGGNIDAKTWSIVNMRKPPEEFKVVDHKQINIATNFKTKEIAQNFINYFKINKFPPEVVVPDPDIPVPDVVVPEPLPTGENVTKDGVVLPYPMTGKVSQNYNNNDRSDGKRMDFKDLKDWTSNTGVFGYFAFPNGKVPDDEVSGKWSVENHSGTADVQCYDLGVGNSNGATRWRYENPHPTYTGTLGKGDNGVPLGTKFVGYLFTRLDLPDGKSVRLETWQDSGDNEEAKPANKWKKIASYVDSKYNVRKYPLGPLITIRVDGSNVVSDMAIKWVTAVEFKPLT